MAWHFQQSSQPGKRADPDLRGNPGHPAWSMKTDVKFLLKAVYNAKCGIYTSQTNWTPSIMKTKQNVVNTLCCWYRSFCTHSSWWWVKAAQQIWSMRNRTVLSRYHKFCWVRIPTQNSSTASAPTRPGRELSTMWLLKINYKHLYTFLLEMTVLLKSSITSSNSFFIADKMYHKNVVKKMG